MPSEIAIYLLVASAFVCIANLIAFAGLSVSYSSSRKTYLALACLAASIEISRQIPDFLISVYPESNLLYILSGTAQFLASSTILYALWHREHEPKKSQSMVFGSLVILYFASISYQAVSGLAQTSLGWYFITSPSILVMAVIAWTATRKKEKLTSGKVLLILSSFSILLLRSVVPAVEDLELYYLLYYVEVLFFPIMLTALNLLETENTHRRLQLLHEEKAQSEEDLQFILDNSLDIIFMVNEFGLLLSWSKRAEGLFGYTADTIIGKMHVDELFSGKFQHRSTNDFHQFNATMENLDGSSLPITACSKTVYKNDRTYSIYVINDVSK